jgi:predicted RNase H-like nuclease
VNKNRGSIGLAISKEAFFVLPELAEIDAVITLALQRRVKEAHPELAFMRANGGTALPPKKSPAGSRARKAILERLGPLPHVVSARQTTSALQRSRSAAVEVDFPRGVGRDDLYDAAISCEVAGRIVEKTPRCEAPSAIHAVCAWRSSPGGRLTWSTVELTACCT